MKNHISPLFNFKLKHKNNLKHKVKCIEINNSKMHKLAEKRKYESSIIIEDKSGYEPVSGNTP